MPRYRSRSRSYSPRRRSETPPSGRKRYHEDFGDDRYRESRSHRGRSPAPSGLLIRNLPLDARPEDLRAPFEKFGQVKDVYLPKNYYTGEPRGFGFVKFRYAEDAAEAKQCMNHKVIGGREIRIVFAEENRKTPQEMRMTSRISGRHGGSYRGRTPPRSPRRSRRSYTPSPSPGRHDSRDYGMRYRDSSPRRAGSLRRSASPINGREYSPSRRSISPKEDDNNHREYERGRFKSPKNHSRSPSGSISRSHGSR